jgi:hypothetical protein
VFVQDYIAKKEKGGKIMEDVKSGGTKVSGHH